ncbi:MAG: M24 family metallopeptidase, partial [Oscillospiraceae bacterium]|nr:M24 family metallopeptidase [Oscillospiraceae bacterium]
MTREEFVAKFEGSSVKAAGILQAQDIARAEMESLKNYLRAGLTREEIHAFAEQDMLAMGSEGWWIHNDPALVLFGPLTTYSAREDAGSRFDGKVVLENDIVTVDVAPTVDGGWGDICRAFFLQDGVVTDWQQLRNDHWREGMEFELELHREAVAFVDETTTFHQPSLMKNIHDLMLKARLLAVLADVRLKGNGLAVLGNAAVLARHDGNAVFLVVFNGVAEVAVVVAVVIAVFL